MATEEKIVYSVEVEGAKTAAQQFDEIWESIQNSTFAVNDASYSLSGLKKFFDKFPEISKRVVTAWDDMARAAGKADDATKEQYKNINELYGPTVNKLKGIVDANTASTEKAGKGFNLAWGKAVKFFGALGFGVYSMYSLASALRRGLRAFADFIREGVEKAIKADAALKGQTEVLRGEMERFTLVLGKEMTPGLKEVTSALGNLVQTLHETGAIEAFGTLLSNMLVGAARGLDYLARGADNLREVVNRIQDEMPAPPDWEKVSRHVKAAVPSATAAMIPFGAASILPSALTAPFAAADWVRGAGEVEGGPLYGERAHREAAQEEHRRAKQPKEKKGAAAKDTLIGTMPNGTELWQRPDGSTYIKWPEGFAAGKGVLAGAKAGRGLAEYRAKSTAGAFGGTPDELAAKSSELTKSLTETKMKIDADAAKEVAKNAEVKGAYVKMWGETIAGAARSGDVKGAFRDIAIDMGAKIATSMAAASVASSMAEGGFGMWFKKFMFGFQDTGHIPGGAPAGGIPAVVHPGEYILKEAQLGALQMGLGIAGGKGKFAYEVPPAAPGVDVHVYPGADVEVKTALRARAGELRLAQLEA